MRSHKNLFIALVGIFLTTFGPVVGHGQKGNAAPPPPTLDVRVVNTTSEPVPVAGTVNVGNIGSSPLLVRDVDSPSRQPVFFNESYTVPTGKRLVVEYVSMGIEALQPCQHLIAGITQSGALLHMYHPEFVGTFSSVFGLAYRYVLSQEARAYIGQNRTVTLEIRTSSGCIPDLAHAGVSGYLVDLQ